MDRVAEAADGVSGLAGLLGELNDLKRVRGGGARSSVAGGLFARAWAALVAGADERAVALETAADAVAAVRLGAIDREVLLRCGLDGSAATAALRRSFDAAAAAVAPSLRQELRARLGAAGAGEAPPPFVAALADQPRAGPTCPGRPRLVLEPPESHAEHCAMVAIYGVLLAPAYGAAAEDAFVLGLAHHLHNALLPDAGFAGEEILGERLELVVEHATAQMLAGLPAALAARVEALRPLLGGTAEPAARAFHAADVIDRVLQVRQYARVARFTIDQAMDELELVHAGPIQAFHAAVLRQAGLP